MWIRIRRFLMHNILHADDPPHPLAMGVAIGIFVMFTPTIGLQMLLVMFLAWMLRANKVVGIPIVWISNPATFVPIFWPCYKLGQWLTGSPPKDQAWWASLRHPPEEFVAKLGFYWASIWEIIGPLTIGCLLIGTVLAVLSYVISYSVIYTYRMKRFGRTTPPQP